MKDQGLPMLKRPRTLPLPPSADEGKIRPVIFEAWGLLLPLCKTDEQLFTRDGKLTPAGAALAKTWQIALESLTDAKIIAGVKLALKYHKYPTLPMPGEIYKWATKGEDEADLPDGQWPIPRQRLDPGKWEFKTLPDGRELAFHPDIPGCAKGPEWEKQP